MAEPTAPSKPRNIVSRIASVAETAFALVLDILLLCVELLTVQIFIIGILFGVGMMAKGLRHLFFKHAPDIIDHSRFWAHAVNDVADTFAVMTSVVRDLVSAVIDFVHLVTHTQHPTNEPPITLYHKPPPISSAQLRAAVKNATIMCSDVNNVWEAMQDLVKETVSPALCPVLRAAYPLKTPNTTVQFLLGWASFDPNPLGGNCAGSKGAEIICVILDSGYIIMELLAPLIVLALVMKYFIPHIIRLIKNAITAVFWSAQALWKALTDIV